MVIDLGLFLFFWFLMDFFKEKNNKEKYDVEFYLLLILYGEFDYE